MPSPIPPQPATDPAIGHIPEVPTRYGPPIILYPYDLPPHSVVSDAHLHPLDQPTPAAPNGVFPSPGDTPPPPPPLQIGYVPVYVPHYIFSSGIHDIQSRERQKTPGRIENSDQSRGHGEVDGSHSKWGFDGLV